MTPALESAFRRLDEMASSKGPRASRLAITWANGVEELHRRGWPNDVLAALLGECGDRLAVMSIEVMPPLIGDDAHDLADIRRDEEGVVAAIAERGIR